MKIIVEVDRNKYFSIHKSIMIGFYVSVGFWIFKKWRIPSDSDADLESVTSLTTTCSRICQRLGGRHIHRRCTLSPFMAQNVLSCAGVKRLTFEMYQSTLTITRCW